MLNSLCKVLPCTWLVDINGSPAQECVLASFFFFFFALILINIVGCEYFFQFYFRQIDPCNYGFFFVLFCRV